MENFTVFHEYEHELEIKKYESSAFNIYSSICLSMDLNEKISLSFRYECFVIKIFIQISLLEAGLNFVTSSRRNIQQHSVLLLTICFFFLFRNEQVQMYYQM